MEPSNEIKAIDQQLRKIHYLGLPGPIMIGLGLYGLFAADGNAFHPLLNDTMVVYGLLALGVIVEIWGLSRLLPLMKKRKKLMAERGAQ